MEKFLIVNLSDKTFLYEELPEVMTDNFLGGRGLGVLLLTKYGQGVPAYSPKNPLIFTVGLLTGTSFPSSVQWQVTSKSPLTNGIGGGFTWGGFGIDLKKTGLMGVVFVGKLETPGYIVVKENDVIFKDATFLWGENTRKTTKELRNRHNNASIATIGPAGEKMSGLASIISDSYHMVIRTGLGAVMGSKNLKAVVVNGEAEIEENDNYREVTKELFEQVKNYPASRRLRDEGKSMLIRSKNMVGDLATNNHQLTSFKLVDNIDADALKKYTVGNVYCPGCSIGCIRKSKTKKDTIEGPGYETIWALGPRIGNGDLEFLIDLYNRCLLEGVDPISLGGVLAFTMECIEKNLVKSVYDLSWGNKDGISKFLDELVDGEGLGGELRDGTKAYYLKNPDTKPYAMEVKGVELSGQEPRQSKAFGLSLAVSNWGADWGYGLPTMDVAHNTAAAEKIFPEFLPEILDVTSENYKAELIKFSEEFNAISDSLGICKFACPETFALMPDDLAKSYNTYADKELSTKELLSIGERIINLERVYNMKEGLSAEDDYLPERFTTTPIIVDVYTGDRLKGLEKTGETRTLVNNLDVMLKKYYELRGWPEGITSEEKLKQLKIYNI